MKRNIFPTIVVLSLMLFACKKDDDTVPTISTKTGMLIDRSWSLTAIVSDEDGNGSYETNDFSTFPGCFTDNFYTFKPTFQFEINDGPTKCDPGDPQIEMGTWALVNNENDLKINNDIYPIVELSNTTLRWREEGPGNTSTIVTMTKR